MWRVRNLCSRKRLLDLTKKGNIAGFSRDPVWDVSAYTWARTRCTFGDHVRNCGSQCSTEIWVEGSTNSFHPTSCSSIEVSGSSSGIGYKEDGLSAFDTEVDLSDGKTPLLLSRASSIQHLECPETGSNESSLHVESNQNVSVATEQGISIDCYQGAHSRPEQVVDDDTAKDAIEKDVADGLLDVDDSFATEIVCDVELFARNQNVSVATEQGFLTDCYQGAHCRPKDVTDDNTAKDAVEKDVADSLLDVDGNMAREIGHKVEPEEAGGLEPADEKSWQKVSPSSDFYEEVKITADAGEPLMPRSLLDLAVEDIVQENNEQGRSLFQKFKEAAERGRHFTCKSVIDSWVKEGNTATRPTLMHTIFAFWSWKKNKRALELLDWVMTEKHFELTDVDHAIHMDLVGKIDGYRKASKYYTQLPKSFRTSMVYSVLLAAYVDHNMEKSARRLLTRARLMGVTELVFLYNQVMLFFKGKGRISDVANLLKEMEDDGVRADLYTYNIILDLRARKGDAMEMRKIWKMLEKETNLKPDAASYAILARGYIMAGSRGKAELAMKHIESSPCLRKQLVYRWLLKLYAHLKREDELERVWDLLKNASRALVDDYTIMIQSLGKAGELERAEELFEEGVKRFGIKRLHQYHALISVYLDRGLIQKAEDLIEKMSKDSFNPGAATYHQLIEMHVKNGDELKAMETLSKSQNASKIFAGHKPWYVSYLIILEMFGEKGNVDHAEVIIRNLKSAGYPCGFKMYSALLKAYVKANMTPHGFLDRMRADGAIPNSSIRKELYKVSRTERGINMISGQPF